jgi:hypothetical protein
LIVALVGILGLAVLASTSLLADTAVAFVPPEESAFEAANVKLMADRQFGFAPLKIHLSGMLQSREGDLFPLDGEQRVRLVVESPFLHVQNSSGESWVGTDFRLESTSSGPEQPNAFTRFIELKRPGRYVFRLTVLDTDGRVVQSDEVTVKAL